MSQLETASPDASMIKSLVRAMEIVEALARHEGGATVTDLAGELGLPKSSVFRALHTFEELHYVRQDPATACYHLGVRFLQLASAVERDSTLRAIARPLMLELGARTQETVHLALPVDEHMVYIDKVESPRSVVMASRVGQQLRLHCSSLGKAYLSALDPAARRALVGRISLDRRTSRTLTTRKALLENLEICAERGYAMDDLENEDGVRCVGAAIRDSRGDPIAAISISVPAERWSLEQAHEGGKLCAETAAQISVAFGAPDTRAAVG